MLTWCCKNCNDWTLIEEVFAGAYVYSTLSDIDEYGEIFTEYDHGEILYYQCKRCGEEICRTYDELEKLVDDGIIKRKDE